MARVLRKGAGQRPRRRLGVWILVTGIIIFLVLMLPSEKPMPQAAPQQVKSSQQGTTQEGQELSAGSTAADAAAAEKQADLGTASEQAADAAAAEAAAADAAAEQQPQEQPAEGEDAAAAAAAEQQPQEQRAEGEDAAAAAAAEEQPQEQPAEGADLGTESTDGTQAGEAAQGAEAAAGSTAVGTGVFYEVPAEKEGDPPTRAELLEEPVPEDCFVEEHADYEGPALTWGLTFKLPSAAQCCQACKDRRQPGADGMYCNVWVWCGSRTGECWSQDIWNHTTGECWLKYQKDWDNNVDRAATNLRVNRRGKYPPEFRQEHKTSPEEVAWTAGVIPIHAAA